MPEGDTVYREARSLGDALRGSVLTRCDIRVPQWATIDLTGETVQEIASRGKHLLIRTDSVSVHSHLKMEGSWHLYRHGTAWQRPAFQARIVLETLDCAAAGFDLGVLELMPRTAEVPALGYLGPDLLGADWDAGEAVRRLAVRPDVPVAVALADQRNLAGLGNVYVNELCFLRGILPTRLIGEVTDLPALVGLAHRLINANRDRVERTTTGNTRRGARLWVHSRHGQACRRCGTRLVRSKIGRSELELRDVFWCPRCQT
ncbi:DNA-formamidopyrimidine glycosylase family protein [Cryobacterium psychrophilum]|uniref:DNA-(apurinic or apyrimidinic site) lyase n=1 Tax=Cryobacterium psychrophilum TaxID=41988 RepID=A0A4Y8KNK2_9MICO|nr:DNA-formamidopyrimidine glycosylase family protein [Cryobacterium psychrophilum]TDW28999.1 endonuclease-8 [Cryobacterium psychrophilum]TFD79781.1 Fpg/Nei family DNA glycosylase [Cryobacterium psychrophilum]